MTVETGELPDGVEAEPRPCPHRIRRRMARRIGATIIALALILLIVLIGIWTQRKSIASDYVDRELTRRGVPARYRIADLGFNRQRLTNVVIGDPARPDLVADWVELRTSVGFSGARLKAIRAGRVRVRARLAGGRVSFGAIDRLLPRPSGKPFAFPSIGADVADARIRLDTPRGLVGLKISGGGRLDDGFTGTIAAVSPRLELGGCVARGASAAMAIRITRARPALAGPLRADLACGGTLVRGLRADAAVSLSEAIDRWQGSAKLALTRVSAPAGTVTGVRGTIGFTGGAAGTSGPVDLRSAGFASAQARGAALSMTGRYRIAGGGAAFRGRAGANGVAVAPARLAAVAGSARAAPATPFAPLARKLAAAAIAAGRAFDVEGEIDGAIKGGAGRLLVSRLALAARSGARVTLRDGGVSYRWPGGGGTRVAGALDIRGGGLPQAAIRLAQAAPGAPVTGVAMIQPYTAEDARIALTPLRFAASPRGNTRFATTVTLSGPLGDGRVDSLTLPVSGVWDGGGALAVNPDCAPLGFQRLAISGLVLAPARLRLCPISNALVRLDGGGLRGGATIAAPRLTGTLGRTPISLAAAGSRVRLGDGGFGLDDFAVRIGSPGRVTRLDFGTFGGRIDGAALRGSFGGGTGQIANVPLLASAAAGDWSLVRGALAVRAAMVVSDAAPDPRFVPLTARDVALTLAGGRIAVNGRLVSTAKGIPVADVTIAHDLTRGTGKADLDVAGITFGERFQPDELTRLTYGVIANVAGTVTGTGRIRWNPVGVTSDGVFRTANTDLAAAFGPVTGLAGETRFTDLLKLESAPGQIATVKTINPGIAVNDGVIRYQTLANTRVQVEGARWPFAGGELMLEPTLLDFAEARQRRMTFRVTGMDAGQFLQQFDFKNLNATGIFDGRLPMVFDQSGGSVVDGRLKVRPGGGTLAYVGVISQKNLGFWGNFAFQALKSLRYRDLDIVMNGPLAGEMVTEVRFAGVGQGAGAKRNFIVQRLTKLPLIFNVRIRAPFRSLIDSARSFYDPRRLIEQNLPALIDEQRRRAAPPPPPIQPPASRSVP